jgi:hypothetical protein
MALDREEGYLVALLTVLHRVRDYAAWRAVYDGAADLQRANGVTAESVHRAAGDPNNVLVLHHFATVAEAQAFVNLPDLKSAMQQAGVEGPPRIEIFE